MPKVDNTKRNSAIIAAHAVNIPITEIAEIMGLAPNTVARIVAPAKSTRTSRLDTLKARIEEQDEPAPMQVNVRKAEPSEQPLKTYLLVDGHADKSEWDKEAVKARREAYREAKASGASYAEANKAGLWAVADWYEVDLIEVEAESLEDALAAC